MTESARGLLNQLDEIHRRTRPHYPELDARIEAYGLAARMQLSAGEALDLTQESQHTLVRVRNRRNGGPIRSADDACSRDGLSNGESGSSRSFSRSNRGTATSIWRPITAPSAIGPISRWRGLLRDLKQRGLLDSTLVIWGGEFGRTPTSQKSGDIYTGRDHNMQAFTSWMAGGGVRGGTAYGNDRRIWPRRSSRIRSVSTTFTPRFCICWDYTISTCSSCGADWRSG